MADVEDLTLYVSFSSQDHYAELDGFNTSDTRLSDAKAFHHLSYPCCHSAGTTAAPPGTSVQASGPASAAGSTSGSGAQTTGTGMEVLT